MNFEAQICNDCLKKLDDSRTTAPIAPQGAGWICPVCGRGNAPWSPSCPCGGHGWGPSPTYPGYPTHPGYPQKPYPHPWAVPVFGQPSLIRCCGRAP